MIGTDRKLDRAQVGLVQRPAHPHPSIARHPAVGALAVFGLGPALLLLLALVHVTQGQADVGFRDVLNALLWPSDTAADNIVRYIRLPRLTIGILAGAGLGMAGVLLQTVTRNPLASPSTLGVTSGAYLAIVASTIFAPGVFGLSPVAVAFVGGMIAAILAFLIAGASGITPIRLALAGVAVSLVFASLTALLQLFYENETAGLFFWGAGSLMENDWSGVTYAWPRLLAGGVVALLIGHALDVLLMGDDVARALGQRVQLTRIGGTVTGVFLAAVAVSVVGPIGFVGLIVPHVVRLLGIRRHRLLLLGAAIWGAVVLIAADVMARTVTTTISELPAGGVTALIGAPFFVWLARRSAGVAAAGAPPRTPAVRGNQRPALPYPALLAAGGIALLVAIAAGTVFGDVSIDAPTLIETLRGRGTALSDRVILDLRLPRLLVAALAGAALAVSGVLLQGVVRNPLAGPEIVGVVNGAGLGGLLVLVLLPGAPFAAVPVAAFIGAFVAFAVVYAVSWSGGITPARLALVGVAVSAFCAAAINLLVVKAELRVAQALVWLSGSTYARGWDDLLRLAPWLVVLLPLAWLVGRQLDVLALGDDAARGVGVLVERVRLISLTVGVALAAAAVSAVGTIGFVGLIGPHTARLLLGNQRRHQRLVLTAALFGAILVTLADTIGRTVLAPKEIPSGLVTAVIGAPYFLWLLRRSR